MNLSVKGIVLSARDFKENDKILSILTFEKGKISVVAKGVKKGSSKFKAFAQSFCFADFELVEGKNGFFVLSGVNLIDNFFDLSSDYEKYAHACLTLEILEKICVENQDYSDIFIDELKTLRAINYKSCSAELAVCKFVMSALKTEGMGLNVQQNCAGCKLPFVAGIFLDLSSGNFLCHSCQNFDCEAVDRGVFSTIKILSNTSYDLLCSVRISKNLLTKTKELLLKVLSQKFDVKLNSLNY